MVPAAWGAGTALLAAWVAAGALGVGYLDFVDSSFQPAKVVFFLHICKYILKIIVKIPLFRASYP